jgi:hypothetical protein
MKHIGLQSAKWSLNLLPLSYISLFYKDTDWTNTTVTNWLIMIEDLSSSFLGLSDCVLSLTNSSAHSLLSFTVRSSTSIVTSWEDNLEPALPGQLLSDTYTYSQLQREISLPLIVYRPIRSTHNTIQRIALVDLSGLHTFSKGLFLYKFG